MGEYILMTILSVIIFSFIFGENVFKSSWIPSSIRASLLTIGAILFYAISGYCFYNFAISSSLDHKYLYFGVGAFLVILTTVIMIRGVKNISIHQEEVDTNAKEANVVVVKESKNNNVIGKVGIVMIVTSIVLIIVTVSFLYL